MNILWRISRFRRSHIESSEYAVKVPVQEVEIRSNTKSRPVAPVAKEIPLEFKRNSQQEMLTKVCLRLVSQFKQSEKVKKKNNSQRKSTALLLLKVVVLNKQLKLLQQIWRPRQHDGVLDSLL